MRLSHWLSRFFSQVRHHIVPKGNAIPRRRRAHRADFSQPLEVRCLLSAVANDDSAQVKGKSAIHLNVLANDTSTVGGLRISSAGATSAGSVSLLDSDNDGLNDQLIFTPSTTFSGSTTIFYTISDSAGSTDSATVSIEVMSNVGMVGSNTSGELGVVGGFGGTNYEPSPTSGYAPTQLGNYTTTEVVNDPTWTKVVSVGNENVNGSGSQTLTNTVVSTYTNSDNWFYSETVTYSYDLWAYGSGGDYSHEWGGYTSTFTVTMLLGVNTTTRSLTTGEFYDFMFSSSTSSAAGSSSTSTTGGGSHTLMLLTTNIDNPVGPDSGISNRTETMSGSTSGSGTYTTPTTGGSVSGTMNENSNENSYSMYALSYSQDLYGNWLIGGIANFNGGAGNHFDYSGSGTFGDSTFAGDITVDSGYQDSGYSYSGSGTLAMGSSGPFWSLAGTGKATGGNGSAFAMNGSGSYTTSGSGWSMSGTRTGSDSRHNDYSYQVDYSLSGGVWGVTGGSGSGGGGEASKSDYSGSGSYTRAIDGGSVTGTTNDNGKMESWTDYKFNTTLGKGGWTATGSGSGGGGASNHSDYSGSGSYTRPISGGTISGDFNEDGHQTSWNTFDTKATLVNGAWVATGTGKNDSDGHTHTDSSGSGSFTVTTGSSTGPNYSYKTISGDAKESYTYDTSYSSQADWVLGTAGWQMTSGSGNNFSDTSSESSQSGSGSYGRGSVDASGNTRTVTGTITTSAGGKNSYNGFETKTEVIGGEWKQVSGSGWAGGGESSKSAYSGKGTYSRTGQFGAAITGDVDEGGDSHSDSSWSTDDTWSSTDGWTTTGSASDSGGNSGHSSYSGSGSYGSSGATSGSGTSSFSGTVNEDGGSSNGGGYDIQYKYVQPAVTSTSSSGATPVPPAPSGWIATSGNSSGSNSASSNMSYSGSGSYTSSGTSTEFGTWSISGTNSASGKTYSSSSGSESSKIDNGNWVVVSGTGTAGGGDESHSSHSGSGTYSNTTPGGQAYSADVTQSGGGGGGGSWSTSSTRAAGTILGPVGGMGEGGASSSGADGWTTTGSASGSANSSSMMKFTISKGTYSNGKLHGFKFESTTSNSDYTNTLGTDGKWVQTAGNALTTWNEGEGKGYSGGGSLPQGGLTYDEAGNAAGIWYFGGSFTESGDTWAGGGTFSKEKWTGTKWEEVDWGETDTGGWKQSKSWSGSGGYSRGPLAGTFDKGGSDDEGFSYTYMIGSASESGSATYSSSGSGGSGHDASGTLTFSGATGTYSTGAHDSSEWSETIEYDLVNIGGEYDYTEKSGTSKSSDKSDSYQKFDGSGAYMTSGTVTFQFGYNSSGSGSEEFTYDPSAAPGPNGEEPDPWVQSSGSASSHYDEYYNYDANGSSPYTTANGVVGTQTSKNKTHYTFIIDSGETFTPGSGTTAASWTQSGSGKETYDIDYFSSYSASGAITGGTYEESGHSHAFGISSIDHTLGASGWTSTGSGSAGGDAHGKYSSNVTASYTNGAITGSTTTKDWENWNADYKMDGVYQYDSVSKTYGWVVTGGSGSGHADGGYDTKSSGTGSYTVSFANGAGTASGTQNESSHFKWGYNYDETSTWDTALANWKTDGSGSGSGDGHGHYDYSAKGSYGSSSNGGSLDVNGGTDSKWDAKWDWDTKGNYKAERNWSGSSLADSTEKSWHSSKTTTPMTAPYTGSTTSESSGSSETKSHSQSDYKGKKNWLTDSTGSSWWSESSGSSSGFTETTTQGESKYSWNWTLAEPNHTKTDVGYSSFGSYMHEKDEWNHSYSGKASSDGSSDYTYTSGGAHQKDWKYWGSYSDAWTETWSYGGMSGSGSGGGYSYTSSGGGSGSWSGSGSESGSWGGSWSITIPANSSTSGSGGGTGGGGTTTSGESGGSTIYITLPSGPNAAPPDITGPAFVDLSILDNAALVSVAPEDPPPSDDDSSWLDYAQTGLDVVGLIPGLGEVADLANAGISLARGNYGEAALSLAAMVPFAGAAATAGKFAKKAGKFIAKNLDKADEVATGVTKLGDEMAAVTKQGDNAADAGKGLQKGDVRSPCFPAGTPVLTPRGPVAIEEIRKGDWVLSRDECDETGEVAPRQVEKTFVRYGAIYALQVAGRTIRVTDEHPVYVEGRGWTSVNEVMAGERLSALTLPVGSFKPLSLVLSAFTVGAGIGDDPGVTFSESDTEALPPWSSDWLVVESNESTGDVDVVYNFRVNEWHTYFVGSDDWGFSVWVHNSHTGKNVGGEGGDKSGPGKSEKRTSKTDKNANGGNRRPGHTDSKKNNNKVAQKAKAREGQRLKKKNAAAKADREAAQKIWDSLPPAVQKLRPELNPANW